MNPLSVAVFVVGDKNVTRITGVAPLSDATLDWFARLVAEKAPDRNYMVMAVSERSWRKREGALPLYTWHVGDGFTHAEGWWVS